ncbi:MAG TPA: hypothetical protein VM933_07575 [Acidimicrobiales bacterium]|nr:hypothetical protein [Acidimicrobiales bacterium]
MSRATSPARRLFRSPPRAELGTRLPRLVAGLLCCGAGVASMVRAGLGLGPWEVLHQGLAGRAGLTIGTVSILVAFVVLVGWIPLRQPLGIGTIANAVLIGLTTNAVLAWTESPAHVALRVVALLGGILLLGFGSGLYIGAGLGPGPRDGLMTGIATRSAGRFSIRLVRTGIELAALALGWVLGGTVGVGTLLFALSIGPLVQFFLDELSIPVRIDQPELAGPAE